MQTGRGKRPALGFHHPGNARAALWDLTSTMQKYHYPPYGSLRPPHHAEDHGIDATARAFDAILLTGNSRRQSWRMCRIARRMANVSEPLDILLYERRFAPLIYPEVFRLFPYPIAKKHFFSQRVQTVPYGLTATAFIDTLDSGDFCLAHAEIIVGIDTPELFLRQLQQSGV